MGFCYCSVVVMGFCYCSVVVMGFVTAVLWWWVLLLQCCGDRFCYCSVVVMGFVTAVERCKPSPSWTPALPQTLVLRWVICDWRDPGHKYRVSGVCLSEGLCPSVCVWALSGRYLLNCSALRNQTWYGGAHERECHAKNKQQSKKADCCLQDQGEGSYDTTWLFLLRLLK